MLTYTGQPLDQGTLCRQNLHRSMVHWNRVHCWHEHFQHVNVPSACREQDLENRLRRYFGANVTQSHLKMAEAPAGEQTCRYSHPEPMVDQ